MMKWKLSLSSRQLTSCALEAELFQCLVQIFLSINGAGEHELWSQDRTLGDTNMTGGRAVFCMVMYLTIWVNMSRLFQIWVNFGIKCL